MTRRPSIYTNSILRRLPDKRGVMQWVDTYERTYQNYKTLLKDLPEVFRHSSDGIVTVYRSRRGQWGEWFEKWHMAGNKPQIFKEGWM